MTVEARFSNDVLLASAGGASGMIDGKEARVGVCAAPFVCIIGLDGADAYKLDVSLSRRRLVIVSRLTDLGDGGAF